MSGDSGRGNEYGLVSRLKNLDVLLRTADWIKSAIQVVPGLTPPVVEPVRQTEELHIRLRPHDLAFYGVSRAYVAEVATVILGGLITSTLCEFLIHPGLFWRFSGKDAKRLALAGDLEDGISAAQRV